MIRCIEDIACFLVETDENRIYSVPTRFLYKEPRLAVPGTGPTTAKITNFAGEQRGANTTYCLFDRGTCLPYRTLAIWVVRRQEVTGYIDSTRCGDTGKGESGSCMMGVRVVGSGSNIMSPSCILNTTVYQVVIHT